MIGPCPNCEKPRRYGYCRQCGETPPRDLSGGGYRPDNSDWNESELHNRDMSLRCICHDRAAVMNAPQLVQTHPDPCQCFFCASRKGELILAHEVRRSRFAEEHMETLTPGWADTILDGTEHDILAVREQLGDWGVLTTVAARAMRRLEQKLRNK